MQGWTQMATGAFLDGAPLPRASAVFAGRGRWVSCPRCPTFLSGSAYQAGE